MDRKDFLKSCGMFGVGSCLLPGTMGAFANSVKDEPPTTPCEDKEAFSQKWVKRFFDVFDGKLDGDKRDEIMHANGRVCFLGSIGDKKVEPVDVDILIDQMNKYSGEIAATRDGNVIDFHYVKNPRGLKVADGYCLCPLVESGPKGLSGTYCECSVGYVREMFETYTGKTASVELVESLKRGGKTCRFKITLT